MLRKLWRNKRGQALVEYGILIGAVSIVCLVGATLLGHKSGDILAEGAALLPGDDGDDQGPIFVSKLAKVGTNSAGYISLAGTPGDSTFFLPGTSGTPGSSSIGGFEGPSSPTGASTLVADEPDGN